MKNSDSHNSLPDLKGRSLFDRLIAWCMVNKLVVTLGLIAILFAGIMVAPFDWEIPGLERAPVAVDAIPDIGENQQIVFTKWMGRSPQDVEDQITYPLTVSLLGIPGVKSIRSFSMFGFSSIYVLFNEEVEFYWSRSRLLEKLSSLPLRTLPEGVKPTLGPDATALGQVFWYTLEGRDSLGNPTGGWDLEELRSIQDWQVRYALMAAEGVSEVASIGGFVKEYQIDVNPEAMRANGIGLEDIYRAVKMSNVDVGARTVEINNVEYVVRGLGFIKSIEDIQKIVLKVRGNVPIRIQDIAHVGLGPTLRRGILDKAGSEAVGGVVVARYGANPLEAIKNVKEKMAGLEKSLPKKTLSDGTVSQVAIVPFYDRTGLIKETLGTLSTALMEEILFTVIVILIMVMNLRSSLLISSLLPFAVLLTFIGMKYFGVDANIVALSGIAIAIGTIVEVGVVLCENMLQHLEKAHPEENRFKLIFESTSEVGGAVLTAVATTVVGFLPVFFMEGAEGKLFKPLAYTKTMALVASIFLTLTVLPAYAHFLFSRRPPRKLILHVLFAGLILLGGLCAVWVNLWVGILLAILGVRHFLESHLPEILREKRSLWTNWILIGGAIVLLSRKWMPLGPSNGDIRNFIFVAALITVIMGGLHLLQKNYKAILAQFLEYKKSFLAIPIFSVLVGATIWLGVDKTLGWIPGSLKENILWDSMANQFPGLGKEFMPDLDEGSYLFMPTTMTHASIGEAHDVLKTQDMLIAAVPEVESVVGKLGRAETSLDPAPISMFETIINYKSEYILDENGNRMHFKYDGPGGEYSRDDNGELVPEATGRPFRQWRNHIRHPDDIWKEIVEATKISGTTSAPKLQPIKARIVMLQSGMRAPMGVKVLGNSLEKIEEMGIQIEKLLKEVPSIEPTSVIADRIVGKPYLEIDINREAIARYGLHIKKVQDVIEVAIGGRPIMATVEGRERYPIRIRYQRELRSSLEDLEKIVVPIASGAQIPLSQLAEIKYVRGPQMIKSEDTRLVGYVVFDKKPGYAEVDVVEKAQDHLQKAIDRGSLNLEGIQYKFSGNYENQIRSEQKLRLVLPLSLFIIFLILYFQFKRVSRSLLVFSGVLVAWSGGFILLYLYSKPWFLDFWIFGVHMRELFGIHPLNLSVAVWVGFLALFGVATDDGVVMCTYLDQAFGKEKPKSIAEIRALTLKAAGRRIRPALMTVSVILLALIPILTSTGRGADVMVPMAIPSFGGMTLVLITVFVVPVIYCLLEERRYLRENKQK